MAESCGTDADCVEPEEDQTKIMTNGEGKALGCFHFSCPVRPNFARFVRANKNRAQPSPNFGSIGLAQ